MADQAGQTNDNFKKPQPDFGERKIIIGNPAADRRKLRDMLRGAGKRKESK